jgi:ubiquitin carboxyl-terminal hydrolase 4/11/15
MNGGRTKEEGHEPLKNTNLTVSPFSPFHLPSPVVSVLFRRASAREGIYQSLTDENQQSRSSSGSIRSSVPDGSSSEGGDARQRSELLIAAMDDLQRAMEFLDQERQQQALSPTPSGSGSSNNIDNNNRLMTKQCQRLYDRLEKAYNRLLQLQGKAKESTQGRSTPEQQNGIPLSVHQESPSQQPGRLATPNGSGGSSSSSDQRKVVNNHSINGRHKHPEQESLHPQRNDQQPQQQSPRVSPPVSVSQQKKDVMRLLMGRQALGRTPQQGEALFLLEWNWWCQWCRAVDFFYQNGSTNGATSNADRIQHVLKLLVPGAVLPEKKRKDNVTEEERKDCDAEGYIDSSDDDDEGDDAVNPPGVIDNSILFVGSDLYFQQWYRSNDGGVDSTAHGNGLTLKPNLIRGYHYELIPREVYNALRSWYGEARPSLCRRTTRDDTVILYPSTTKTTGNPTNSNSRVITGPRLMDPRDRIPRCDACLAPGAKSKCKRCMSVHYCDRVCQNSAWPFHKAFCKTIAANSESGDDIGGVKSPPAVAPIPAQSNGRVGLNNLGNTCFMNSALQSLSHATPLTRHFLSDRFKSDLNTSNPLGTGGNLARAYEVVMKDLWMKPGITSTSPTALKRAIAQFAPRFAGCLQHDAQEFLAYLLDGLHEDLNRIRNAPYVEMPDASDGRNMAIAAAEAWDAHKRRNHSLVMDTFYGQFQSTCVCPQCNRISVSFDTFNHVSLEIPQSNARAVVTVPVLVHFADGSRKPVRYGLMLRPQLTMLDLKRALSEMVQIPVSCLMLADIYENTIYDLLADNKSVASIQPNEVCLVAYEVKPHNTPDTMHMIMTHSLLVEDIDGEMDPGSPDDQNGTMEETAKRHPMGLPFMMSMDAKQSTCRDVWEAIWKMVRRYVVSGSGGTSAAKEEEFAEEILTIRAVESNGRPRPAFEATGNGSRSSALPRNSNSLLSEYLGDDCTERWLFFSLEWKDRNERRGDDMDEEGTLLLIDPRRFAEYDIHPSFVEADRQQRARSGMKGVTLDQCFQSFSKPERLDEHNMWYCSECKQHVRALKTMKIWRLPNILIVHLKRFEFKHAFRRDKLDTFVDFPLEGMDMDPHSAHWRSVGDGDKPFVDNNVPAVYDLFAVVNHYGRMGFGHYTAFGMRWDETGVSKEWNLYDDSSVRRVQPGDVPTAAAYILFYRRREFN